MTKKNLSPALKKIFKNYWAISTVILVILLVLVLVFRSGCGGMNANTVGQKVIDFAKAQGAEATLVKVNDQGQLYEVVLEIGGQTVPVYATKDGANLIPSLVPLTARATQDTPAPTPTNTNIPKSDKPVVEAFVMSHCPYGTQIEKGLIPVIELLGDKIDAKIKFVYYAMHPSQGEVQEQLNQYCIQSEQNTKFIPYLKCFLDKGDGAGCITSTGIDKAKLATCVDTTDKQYNVLASLEDESKWLSGRFPKFDIYKADNEKYSVGGSPTLIINGVEASAGRDSASLLTAICGAFNNAPAECDTQLSSAQPSPGFGYSTTTSTNNAAQCG